MKKRVLGITGVFLLPVALYFLFCFIAPNFGSHTLPIILSQAMIPTAMGMGMATIMMSGLMDFSAGCRVLFAATAGYILHMRFGLVGFVLGCFIGAFIISLVLALLYRYLRIPSMVVSLGVVLLAEAVTYWLSQRTGGSGFMTVSEEIYKIGSYPYNIILTIAAGIIFYIIAYQTKIGCQIQAAGDNEILVLNMGVDSAKIKFQAYLLSAVFIGFAAILQMSYAGSITLQTNMTTVEMVFKPMMGVMVGMVLVKLWDVLPLMILAGELIISILFNGLIAMGLTDDIQNIVLGAFLLIVMGTSNNYGKFLEMSRRRKVRLTAGAADL
ncbi:ABC transporter permease [Diplocloster agilis]|uniref:ABC transporter permease n=1 Tax=Diplocloster agilis TaxID=2850323 RepID=UPI000822A346|nr:hypothetical protein [Suonthocola fibrivorans]MCU6735801.1 hypothetical protein [Suonthocola fibrivorans]SCJ82127.1 Inner membrane ABC transporter permease protein yjfF [uncultured Clostridium sp.]